MSIAFRIFAVVCIATLTGWSSAAFGAGPHGTQFGQPFTDTGYVALNDQVAQALADTGAGFVRVNFRLGPYQSDTPAWYAAYDGIVDRLRSRGLEIIGLMTNEAWPGSQAQWTENAYETTGGDGWNTYLSNWCNFFLRAATHWKGKIKYWELWNEPDCLAVIYPSNFGALLANAYDLVHTNNIPVEIISGGVCGGTDPPYGPNYIRSTYDVSINHTGWFTRMKNKWGTYPLDHIGFHIYPNCNTTLNTTWLSNYFDTVRNAYTTYEGANTKKKLWLTEIGWQTDGTGCKTTEAIQASNLTAAFAVANNKSYIKHVNWFFLKDEPAANLYFGVFRHTGLSEADKKPSWQSLKTACTYEGRWSAGGSVNQPILDYFNAKGHVALGNPVDNGLTAWVHNWDFGPAQDYDGGTLGPTVVVDSADGTGVGVWGVFRTAMLDNRQALEFPLGDQFSTGSGARQNFEGGYVTWSETEGVKVVIYSVKLPLDNSDTGFSCSSNWSLRTAADAFKDGQYRRRSATTSNTDPAVWTIQIPRSGTCDVYARWPTVTNASSTATYEIVHSSGTATVTVNQQTRCGRWNRLGTFKFEAGTATIRLSSQGDSGKYVLADAVRVICTDIEPDTTPPSKPVVTDEGEYTSSPNKLKASWSSVDPESGIDHYEYAVGTAPTDPGSGYVVPWTACGLDTSVTCELTLVHGTVYYFYVRAYNKAGLVSEVGVSDGIKVDLSAPVRPTVTDDGDYTGDSSMLHCTWTSTDPESGIGAYEYCVGTVPYGSDVVPLTDVGTKTEVWVKGLNLTPGQKYYFTVRARNRAGLTSAPGYSDGIKHQPVPELDTIASALATPDLTAFFLRNKSISAAFADRIYIAEESTFRGIAVIPARSISEGKTVDVTGTIQTQTGERVIVTGSVTPIEQ
ncbi:MAG: hypothetical protein QHI38_03730 [Armatimonadota bacterium]|nr:hypothetical protein [Armatimonadota bacterium]